MRTPGAMLALATLLAACQPSETDRVAATATSAVVAPPASSSASAPPSAPPAHPHAGTWTGDYQAARGTISVPEGVPYTWWDGDRGTEATGTGTIRLEISPQGGVSGTSEGALGPLSIRGALEGDTLSAGLVPAGDDDAGMSGVLVGELKDAVIEATVRVSSHDAKLVRHATVRLSRRDR